MDRQSVLESMMRFANEMDQAGLHRLADVVTSRMERLSQTAAKTPWHQLLNSQGSAAVSRWQTFLNTQGAKLNVDGAFGPLTKQATMQFQKSKGLLVDGLVGPQTLAAAGLNLQGTPAGKQQGSPGSDKQTAAKTPVPGPPSAGKPQAYPPEPAAQQFLSPVQPVRSLVPAAPVEALGSRIQKMVSGPENQVVYLGTVAATADSGQMGTLVDQYHKAAATLSSRFNSVVGELERFARQSRDQKAVLEALAPVQQAIKTFRSTRRGSIDPKVGGFFMPVAGGRLGEKLEAAEQTFRGMEQAMVSIVSIANLG